MTKRADQWKVSMTQNKSGSWRAYIWPPGLYGAMAYTSVGARTKTDCKKAALERIEAMESARSAESGDIFYVEPRKSDTP